jgi:hypothetical protein
MAVLITFGVLMVAYWLIMWLTREGGPADIVAFFDEDTRR